MRIIASDKDAVLRHLDRLAADDEGNAGEFILAEDDNGHMYLTISGLSFTSTGTVPLGGKKLQIVNGFLKEVEE